MANRGQPIEKGEPVLLSLDTFYYATTMDMTEVDQILMMDVDLTVGGWGNLEIFNTTFIGWTVKNISAW
jgi:hypothetical protein